MTEVLKNVLRTIQVFFFSFPVRVLIGLISLRKQFETWGKPTVLHFEQPYEGQKIMLLALYEKGELRPDVMRLLKHAKDEGLYVIAVNTLRLTEPAALKELIDCYYEKPNFGRDFSSYKVGFLHVFKRGLSDSCPRLMMINDSIYFSDDRMRGFLSDMMRTDLEVLGSTENFDIEYHLGSFCLAVNQSILLNKKFQNYWKNYRLSDVRPTVIKRGELALSRVLKSVMRNPSELTALYSAHRFYETVEKDPNLFDFVLKNARASTVFAWKRVDAQGIAQRYVDTYLRGALDPETVSIEVNHDSATDMWQLRSLDDVKTYLHEALLFDGQVVDDGALYEVALKEVIDSFVSGSQIHQNAALLLKLGLPIVKLDGLYRGIFDMADVYRVTDLLDEPERAELRALLMSRPYGRRYFTGWRQVAFERGYI